MKTQPYAAISIAGLALLLLASTAHAAIYQCKTKNGSAAYSDMPCDDTAQSAAAPPDLHAATRDKSARETSAILCSTSAFNDWIKAQGHPLPDPNVRIAKMVEISNQCRRPLNLPDMQPPVPAAPPKPILDGVAGDAAAAHLQELVKSDSIEQVQRYLSTSGVDVNDRPGADESLLDYAAEQNQAHVARFLIEHGARVDAIQSKGSTAGYTALHRAAIADASRVAELLLAHGAEVNVHGPLGVTPLILAASNGSRDTVEVLLKHGADISVADGKRETALSAATDHDHADIVRLLLIHVPTPTANFMNTLAMRGDVEGLRLLVRHDELVHDISLALKNDALRFTILGPERLEDRKQMIALLLSDGADIDNTLPGQDVTPVMLAPTPEMAEFLFEHGANKTLKVSGARLAQWLVCNNSGKNLQGTLQVVVDHGIDISGTTSQGHSALACAERVKNSSLTAFLMTHHVGPDVTTAYGASLSQRRACVALDLHDNGSSPVELYARVADCVHNNRDADAVGSFALAGMYSNFDALRVADQSAIQARQILIMALFQELSAAEHDRFDAAMKSLMSTPKERAMLCQQLQAIGPPRYFPTYMVNHGLGMITGALNNQPPPPPLKTDFEAEKVWVELQKNYLYCAGGHTPEI